MAPHMRLGNREMEALELEDNGTLCMRVTPLHHIRAIAPMWCAQRCLEPRKLLATLETEASGLWMAWTLGPAAAQVTPRESPLELEASEHHWPLGNQEDAVEDAELRLELVDLGPESIGLELRDTEALELVDNGTLCTRVTPLHHIRAIAPMWCTQRCLELQDNGQGALEDPSP